MAPENEERWLDIPGYEGWYQVSDHGRVRGVDRYVPHARYGRQFIAGQLIIPQDNGMGRLQVGLRKRQFLVHRLVMSVFVGPCPDGMEVCHNNGDPQDNRLCNLRYDTHSGNMQDCKVHGTQAHQQQCVNGHRRDEHEQYFWRGQRFCNTCRLAKIKRANDRRAARKRVA